MPCSEHSECGSLLCDTYGDLPGGTGAGKCMPTTSAIYVDNSDANPACEGNLLVQPAGTLNAPMCAISSAIERAKSEPNKTIRVLASPNAYFLPPLDASSRTVVLVGPGFQPGKGASLVTLGEEGTTDLRFTGATVTIDGFRFGLEGITASGGKITIRRSKLDYQLKGIRFESNCTVTLDRNLFIESALGLTFDSCTVSMTNSILSQNQVDMTGSLVAFNGGSGTFAFNTVAFNTNMSATPMPPLVSCTSSAVVIKNSIFVQNSTTQQLAAGCRTVANSVVVGRGDGTTSQIKQEPTFVNPNGADFQLVQSDTTNQQFLIDLAVEVSAGDKYTDHDYNGAPRPQGAGHDIGAFEAPAAQ